MKTLYWILHTRCRLRCGYCYYETVAPRIRSDFDLDSARALARGLPAHFDRVVLTGGEATLVPWLFDLIAELKRSGLEVNLVSDGLGLVGPFFERLVDANIERLNVSLDSLDARTNSQLRPLPSKPQIAPQRIAEGAAALKRRVPQMRVALLQTLTARNWRSIPAMAEFCANNDIEHHVAPVKPLGPEAQARELSLQHLNSCELDELHALLESWAVGRPRDVDYPDAVRSLVRTGAADGLACHMGRDAFVLDADGTMYPCFTRVDLGLGNVLKEPLDDVLNVRARLGEERQRELLGAQCVGLGCVCLTQRRLTPDSRRPATLPLARAEDGR